MKAIIDKDFETLVPVFMESQLNLLLDLKGAIENNDKEQIVFYGHRLAGSADNYGFRELGRIGRDIEITGKTMNVSILVKLYEAALTYIKTVEIEYIII